MQKKMTAAQLIDIVTQEHLDYNWSEVDFPKDLCTIESKIEDGVFESDSYFLCLLVDVRSPFVSTAEVRTLKPYICLETQFGYGLLFGWVDSCGNVYDHQDHDIHNDRVRVVAWKAL